MELALSILRRATKSHDGGCRSDGVRLALRVLLPHVDAQTILGFWRIADGPNSHTRGHNLRRQLDLIESICWRRLRAALEAEMPAAVRQPIDPKRNGRAGR